jgi:hypothetical protein
MSMPILHDPELKFSTFETLCVYRSFICGTAKDLKYWIDYANDVWEQVTTIKACYKKSENQPQPFGASDWARKLLSSHIRQGLMELNPTSAAGGNASVFSAFVSLAIGRTNWMELADCLLRDVRSDCIGYVSLKFPLETEKLKEDLHGPDDTRTISDGRTE